MTPTLIRDKDCPHVRRCGVKVGEEHKETCPTRILRLSEEDLRRFASLYVEKQPGPKDKIILRGQYKGIGARALLPKDVTIESELASLRWLVEEILITAKARGL